MSTHAQLAGKLLADAATFFRTLASQNEELKDQMTENANVFDQMAQLVSQDPTGMLQDTPHNALAGRLLKDAAGFFRTLAEQNEDIQEQMNENANVYEQLGNLVEADPMGELQD